jgi:TM2 domain-containing membrane protein YozV
MPSPKSRLAALLLAIFFGPFGLHRFYVGKAGTGLVMLLITCTGIGVFITCMWALIDAIMIACGQQKDGEGRIVSEWEPIKSSL